MVKADVRNHAAFRAGDDVGGVVSAAEADLKNDDIAAGVGKPAQSSGGHHLKLGRMIVHRVGVMPDIRHDCGKCVILDLPAVYLHALVKPPQVRRGVQPRFAARSAHDGGEHSAYAALAVCSGDVDEFELRLRISHPRQELRYTLEPEARASPRRAVNVFQCLLVIHIQTFI